MGTCGHLVRFGDIKWIERLQAPLMEPEVKPREKSLAATPPSADQYARPGSKVALIAGIIWHTLNLGEDGVGRRISALITPTIRFYT